MALVSPIRLTPTLLPLSSQQVYLYHHSPSSSSLSLSLSLLVVAASKDISVALTMKLSNMNPEKLFKQHKINSRSVSRSETDPSSFSSHTTSSSSCSDDKPKGSSTPKSVLLDCTSHELKQAIDRERDGRIKKVEFEALLSRLGAEPPRPEELKLMLSEVDTDGDGCIRLEELYAIGSTLAPPSYDLEMRDTFDFFDSDHDGKITAEDLFQVFEIIGDARCTLEDCRVMIRNVDMKGDGFVCFEDFRHMMVQQ